jgi:uncharacterized Rossmann fold enzyme
VKRDFPVVTADGAEQPWMPLRLDMALANTSEQIDANIRAALERPYIPFTDLLEKHSGTVSIVGSGPSLKDTWRELKGDVIACNAANQFLLERGVIPRYVMIFDADILAEEFVTTPHKDVTYLLASRCHPNLFKRLEGQRVVVWHAKGDLNIEAILEEHWRKTRKVEPMIGGGSAAVTRTMFLVHPMGYRDMHIFGVDSSYNNEDTKRRFDRATIEKDDLWKGSADKSHFRKSTTDEKFLAIMCNTQYADGRQVSRVFHTTPWMAAQAEDFKVLVPSLQRIGMKISVHGDGLIPHLAKYALGLDVDGQSMLKQLTRQAVLKARTLWLNL